MFKQFSGKSFGEVIGALVFGIDLFQLEFIGIVPKPVPFIQEISGAVGDAVVQGQQESALIVFKDIGSDGGGDGRWLG